MTQPTGVFVRLPLSEERAITFHKESSHAWDEFNGSSNALACEAGLLAIGTPVTGGKLEKLTHSLLSAGIRQALAPNWPDGLFAMHAKADLMAQEIMTENPAHQAAIAALEAEVGRKNARIAELEEELSGFRAGMSELIAKEVAALEGAET